MIDGSVISLKRMDFVGLEEVEHGELIQDITERDICPILFGEISGKKSRKVALLGDNIALMAKRNGWSGIIVDGCVRDVEILTDIDIGIMAIGSCPKKSKKENKGESNVTISINNVEVSPRNWIYADLNGILVSDDKLSL